MDLGIMNWQVLNFELTPCMYIKTYDPIRVVSFMDGPYTDIKQYGQIFLRQLIVYYFNDLIS